MLMIPPQPPRRKKVTTLTVDKSMKKITVIFCGTEQIGPDDFFAGYQTRHIDLTAEQIELLKPPENMRTYKVFLEG